MEKNLQPLPHSEVIFSSSDAKISQAIHRAVKKGELRKIAPRLYSSNLKDEPKVIIKRNLYHILNEFFPGAVLSHRTAFEGGLSKDDMIILTYTYTKKISLPGITIRLVKGEGAKAGDSPFMENLFLASRERALLENLQVSRERAGSAKTLSREFLEEYLDKLCQVYGSEELNLIRDRARVLAKELKLEKEFQQLEKIIAALLGTQEAKILRTKAGMARASGLPYDTRRLELFNTVHLLLKNAVLPKTKAISLKGNSLANLAFFEAYFSNYIEGTEFTIEEAVEIIFHGKLIAARSEDSHDILGTYQIVSSINNMDRVPSSASELSELLRGRHAMLMSARQDKMPGQFKNKLNRAGSTIFVDPSLVQGTIEKSFALYSSLEPGIARAIFMMFIIAEIHPFLDGNGRIARIMMNAELDHAAECRIIIPTVYREDYLLSLRRLSRESDADPYIRMLIRAQVFTKSIDFSDYKICLNQLERSNAFKEPSEGRLKF